MKYRLLHNEDSHFVRPGKADDCYVRGYEGQIPIRLGAGRQPASVSQTLERIYERHNRDDRPDGKMRPSLSVGDVILLGKVEKAWTVDVVGFEAIDTPFNILEDYPDRP